MTIELDVVTKAKLTLTKYQTLKDLSSLILSNEYNENSINFSRLLVWKLLIIFNGKQLQEIPTSEILETHLADLQLHREKISKDLALCDIPWDQLPKDSEYYQESPEVDIGTRQPTLVDPLSVPEGEEDDLYYLQLIILDIERLFPQEPELFVDSFANRKSCIELLYLYYTKNRIYKQGMHELVGLIFKAINVESLPELHRVRYQEATELQLFSLYEVNHLQQDVYIIFGKLLPSIINLYYDETSLLQESIKFNLKLHQLDKLLYHVVLNKLKIQTPIWILRYFRLVLLRELGISTTLILWDKFIAFGNENLTKLLPYFILLMLLKIRSFILENEHDDILYLLLHYPLQEKITDVSSLVQDCILLYNSSADLAALSKILIYKYCRTDDQGNLKRMISLKKKNKEIKVNSIDDSIGGNQIIPNSLPTSPVKKDFERTRLELRLAKRVSDLLKEK